MEKKAAKERIAKLRKLIDQYRYEYHVLDKLSISEDALDSLKKELFDLEQQYPDLITPDSPTQRVAGKALEGFRKVEHPGRMISLNDAFSENDFTAWRERLDNFLGRPYGGDYYCDIKMDGLAIELVYENGLLVQASTRGNGEIDYQALLVHQRGDAVVGFQRLEQGAQLGGQRRRQGVQGLRAIEGDQRDLAVHFQQQVLVGHGNASCPAARGGRGRPAPAFT